MAKRVFDDEFIRKMGIVANKNPDEITALELIAKGMEIQKALDAKKTVVQNSA